LPPDKKIEAAGYLAQADRDFECDPENSRGWAKKALETVSSAKETDRALIDMLGDLKSQGNIKIVEAGKRVDALGEAAKEAGRLIKGARLESALARLQQPDPKTCYSGFRAIRSEIDQRRSKTEGLVKQGDAALNRKRKEALKLYAAARHIDAEYPGLDKKESDARTSRTSLRGRFSAPPPPPPPPPRMPTAAASPTTPTTIARPVSAEDYFFSGDAKQSKGDLDGALADFSEAILLKPNFAPAFRWRGAIKALKGDSSEAIADFNKAIELNPSYGDAYYSRGLARQKKGDLDGAIADYTKAFELNPRNAAAKARLQAIATSVDTKK
jgi:tetratricopeptide (TPR) repeat protein